MTWVANLPNDAGLHIGIIDVPGHEKFVKNMLAGIGGIDLVLMVIALDEGVMPQTTEHFEILKMLHIKQGILVLTKSDMVDEEWAEMVEADVEDMVRGSFLEHAPVLRVSSYTGENIGLLHDTIIRMVSDLGSRSSEPGAVPPSRGPGVHNGRIWNRDYGNPAGGNGADRTGGHAVSPGTPH